MAVIGDDWSTVPAEDEQLPIHQAMTANAGHTSSSSVRMRGSVAPSVKVRVWGGET